MRITKRQLRRIIKETLLREGAKEDVMAYYGEIADMHSDSDAMGDLLDDLTDADLVAAGWKGGKDEAENYEDDPMTVIDTLTPETLNRLVKSMDPEDLARAQGTQGEGETSTTNARFPNRPGYVSHRQRAGLPTYNEEFTKIPEVQNILMDAGFNADGSFGADGMPGPDDWQLYSPKSMEEVEGWIQAMMDLNEALKEAAAAIDAGKFEWGRDAWYKIIRPVVHRYTDQGADEPAGVSLIEDWLEQKGYDWSY